MLSTIIFYYELMGKKQYFNIIVILLIKYFRLDLHRQDLSDKSIAYGQPSGQSEMKSVALSEILVFISRAGNP